MSNQATDVPEAISVKPKAIIRAVKAMVTIINLAIPDRVVSVVVVSVVLMTTAFPVVRSNLAFPNVSGNRSPDTLMVDRQHRRIIRQS